MVEEGLWQGTGVAAVLELCGGDFGSLLEVSVPVEQLVDFVFDFGLQVELLQEPWDLLRNVLWLSFAFDNLVLDGLLDGPESIAVLDVSEDELAFLVVG